jgi:phosphoesterase RecJ-like protein
MLSKMEVFPEYGAALISLSRDELNKFHYSKGDTEGLVNRPLAIPGVVYSAFMREEDGYVKVSMRSLGSFPVNELCREHFGGGGHLNAAGGEFVGTLDEACRLFRSLLKTNKELYLANL